jgi:hypothetical protein
MAIGLVQQSKKRDLFEQIMLKFTLEKGMPRAWRLLRASLCLSAWGHCGSATPRQHGCDMNILDDDGMAIPR